MNRIASSGFEDFFGALVSSEAYRERWIWNCGPPCYPLLASTSSGTNPLRIVFSVTHRVSRNSSK